MLPAIQGRFLQLAIYLLRVALQECQLRQSWKLLVEGRLRYE